MRLSGPEASHLATQSPLYQVQYLVWENRKPRLILRAIVELNPNDGTLSGVFAYTNLYDLAIASGHIREVEFGICYRDRTIRCL